ncbi:MAG: hypothetical protein JPMHGGIA_00461 [Saprospiraceae bacterium]|jgi:hypothetical protein|nr:hypothetical protein [Saprospiraceae bacterium]
MKSLPKIFIASSSNEKSKGAAEHLATELVNCADTTCWFEKGVFRNGEFTLNELLRLAGIYNLGIFIFNDDDNIIINEKEMVITRDNVILEYGIFVSVIGPQNCYIIVDKQVNNFRIPTDVAGLTYMTYDSLRGALNYSMRECVKQIELHIKESNRNYSKNKYFERFYLKVEPELKNHSMIAYTRSFELLLYMFGNENFLEFRAFDLAFSRWEETFTDRDKISSQITNYSKDILTTTKNMYRRNKCTNFRRIVVIPTIGGVTKITMDVLKLINDLEKSVMIENSNGIFQTKVLAVNQWDHKLDFTIYNDFALFTGEEDEFAIVETTLTSPFSNAAPGNCIIDEDSDMLVKRKDFFEEIWKGEAITIDSFLNIFHKADISETIVQASDVLRQNTIFGQTGIIIETAYIELIKLNDRRRNIPFERAFELLNEVNASNKYKGHIFLDAFINDFRPKLNGDIECTESCEIEDITNDNKFRHLKSDISQRLKAVNSSFNISDELIATFYMTKTRNNAIKHLKKQLVFAPDKFAFDERSDGTRDIYLGNKEDGINLGYQKNENIVPNCALLMAEHYYELFSFVVEKEPALKSIWIFDFLILNEKKYVEQGAKTAVAIYDWTKGKSMNIINCTYDVDGTGDMRHLGPFQF